MRISLVAAVGQNLALGKDNQLLWHLPDDFTHFKKVTMGKPIIMGRKTFLSIGRPLPGRDNIVLTNDPAFSAPGCQVFHSLDDALQACAGSDEVMIIGGGNVYQQAWDLADYLYLTEVHASPEADTFFPKWQTDDWQTVKRTEHAKDTQHQYAFRFIELKRVSR